jgi:hypothetical protein
MCARNDMELDPIGSIGAPSESPVWLFRSVACSEERHSTVVGAQCIAMERAPVGLIHIEKLSNLRRLDPRRHQVGALGLLQ